MLVPDVSTDPSVKRQPCCTPATDGITSTILPPVSTRPTVVKLTVATESKPGVSVAVANVADTRSPSSTFPVAIDDVVSTSLSLESFVVAATLLDPTTDEGVSTLLIVNTCAVDCAMSFVSISNVSVREAKV